MASLPEADHEVISTCQAEFDVAFRHGSKEELEAARFRLIWALVHSAKSKDQTQGQLMAKQKLGELGYPDHVASGPSEEEAKELRDYLYLGAVAGYKLGKYVDARRDIKYLLEHRPGYRQAEALGEMINEALVKEGLIGMGAVLGLAGLAVAAMLTKRR